MLLNNLCLTFAVRLGRCLPDERILDLLLFLDVFHQLSLFLLQLFLESVDLGQILVHGVLEIGDLEERVLGDSISDTRTIFLNDI